MFYMFIILKFKLIFADIRNITKMEKFMEPIQGAPVNFFMGGGRYISDSFNMQLLDTSNPNCFDNLELMSIKPDMMSEYINSEKLPDNSDVKESSDGFWHSIIKFFSPKEQENLPLETQ